MSVPETDSAQPAEGEGTAEASTEANAEAASPERRDPWNDPRLPWSGRPRKADILCWAGIMLYGVFIWATLPLRTSLVGRHPVISELLAGGTESIISAAAFARVGHGTVAVAVLAAIPGLVKFDWLFWWAGRLWGERIIVLLSGRSKRSIRYMERVRRSGRKVTWPAVVVSYFLPIPTAIIYVVAGWEGMGLVTFLILDTIGALLWAGMLAGLGYSLGHHAVVVAQGISHYGLWASIGLAVLIMFFQIRSQRRFMREAAQASSSGSPKD
ncbi:MAG TPA: DedA family protein [Streptosporangiaceae bacterium]